ncbi:ATP-binding cassette sub-family C member 4-like isoform X2 [Dysidea avara]|uniref:ATP-binding cassette sub-family C member 4-like isoform X2 n=1 Tax=Dysidea avara TaxID=196820 RepID=UPI003334182C
MDSSSVKYESPAKNPRKEATWVSRFFFHWVTYIMWKGFRRELKHEDLYATPEESRSQELHKTFNKYWSHEEDRAKRGQKPRLWFAIFQCVKWQMLLHGILFGGEFCFQLSQGILVGYLSEYFCMKRTLEDELTLLRNMNNTNDSITSKQEEIDDATRDAYLYAVGVILMVISVSIIHARGFYLALNAGMQARIITTGAIYNKVLKLSYSSIGKLSIGKIVNLVSNDVQRFDRSFLFIQEIWIAPLFIPIVTYLLWRQIGPSSLAAMAVLLLQSPLQFIFARLYGRWRLKSAKVTDKRVKVMNEIISGMRLIKMYAWEWAFHEYVKTIRKKESLLITKASMVRACNLAFFYVSVVVLNFVSFSTYAGAGNTLTSRRVFTVIALLTFARFYLVIFPVYFLLSMTEMKVAVQRIQKLLLLPELGDTITGTDSDPVKTTSRSCSPNVMPPLKLVNEEVTNDSGHGSLSNGVTPRIIVSNLTASWTHDREKVVLKDINFSVDQSNRLLAVVGPVGSGKSSILQCLLRELEALDGSVDIEGSVSYASQDPWIFSGTIKENILFGQDYDKAWYDRVVECCSLTKDINEMPFGDETLIGERGVNLSGGQKARVNLARAVYRDSDIMLLDDPLSAVDATVSRHLFDRCICGVLADKLVILVTHQLQYAEHADRILVLKEGCVQGYGNYEDLTSSGVDPTELFDDVEDNRKSTDLPILDIVVEECDDVTEETDEETERRSSHAQLLPVEKARRRVRSKHSEGEHDQNYLSVLDEVSLHTTPSLFSLVSLPDDGAAEKTEENKRNVVPEEERAHGTISNKTYYVYLREGINNFFLLFVIVLFLIAEVNIVAADWWLSNWTSGGDSCGVDSDNSSDSDPYDLNTNQRIGIYSGITLSSISLVLTRTVLTFLICIAASRNLHNKMFRAILRAPVLFFDTNPVGRILNRFSKDVGFMDDLLPFHFLELMSLVMRFTAIMIVACLANYWLFIPATVIITIQLIFRWFFLHTSRHVKRLEALARSPLYSHISSTIQGLSTIRAYKEEEKFSNNLHYYLNEHTKGWYMYIVTNRWFGLRIDLISSFFIAIVVLTAVPLADSLDPGLVGLSLVYVITLTGMFQYCVRISAEVENLLVSVERVMAYGQLESEAELETIPHDKAPPLQWPDKGVIDLHNTKFKYAIDYPYVLKSISFRIESCEKVGIVGRTGAGKSSLLSAFFRLAEPEGVFEIDGIQITDIGLHDLRKKMSIIPQDPVLFSGTVRYNLDPFNELEDHQLWDALEEVQLKEVISNLENGLESQVSEGGSNFSVGQRQLMCLARALLRRNKILVIDEATANVDLITDGIIQEMIRKKFNHCTILTIAHRLETIMDSDRVLVLSSGKVIEFDTPFNLLQKQQSVFHSMVKRTGPVESERLREIAIAKEKLNLSTTEFGNETVV